MVVVLLALVGCLLFVLTLLVLGTLMVLASSLQAFVARLESPASLQPGDTVWINALGQLRECVVAAQDANGTAIIRPIGPNVAVAADD